MLKYNASLAEEYMERLREMEEQFGLDNDVRVSTLSRYPEVLTMEEQALDEEEIWNVPERAPWRAPSDSSWRPGALEGENLRRDILEKLDGMMELVGFIEERAPQIIAEYREKLEEKVKELLDGHPDRREPHRGGGSCICR